MYGNILLTLESSRQRFITNLSKRNDLDAKFVCLSANMWLPNNGGSYLLVLRVGVCLISNLYEIKKRLNIK